MSFPADSPEAVVVARIDAQVAALTSGTNLFRGPERAPVGSMPHLAVFVRQYGGRNSPDMGVSTDDRTYKLQVLIRGNVDDRAGAVTVADACLAACDRADPSQAGYVWLTCREAGWTDLGLDATEHPRLSFNVELIYSG